MHYNLRLLMAFLAVFASTYGNVINAKETQLAGRIVGGQATNIQNYPWQASLFLDGRPICGAVFITNTTLVTAAHCATEKINRYTIRFGSTNVNSGQSSPVSGTLTHPKYNSIKHDYDIALMYLPKGIVNTSTTSPIAIADSIPPDGSRAIVTGWGLTTENGASSPSALQEVEVPIVSCSSCNLTYSGKITERMLCAGAAGKDSCQGDSGGPLMYNKKLIGTVSWGNGCARPSYPGVYGNIISMRSWIAENQIPKI